MPHTLSAIIESLVCEREAGFRPSHGCLDQIFTVQQLIEKRHIYPFLNSWISELFPLSLVDLPNRMTWQITEYPRNMLLFAGNYDLTLDRVRSYGPFFLSFAITGGERQVRSILFVDGFPDAFSWAQWHHRTSPRITYYGFELRWWSCPADW